MNTKINDGGPAFPLSGPMGNDGVTHNGAELYPGMSLRAWLAGMALNGLMSDPEMTDAETVATIAVKFADALLNELEE